MKRRVRQWWRRLRHIVRPSYGVHWHVTPRRWWSREDRKAARLMAILMDANHEEVMVQIHRAYVHAVMFGEPIWFDSTRR